MVNSFAFLICRLVLNSYDTPIKEIIMSITTLTPVERINQHLQILGYGGSHLHKLILQWDNANGSEWTVERLKTLKNHFIHIMANLPFEKEWIAYKGTLPKGPFGTLFRLGLKNPKICLAVLNSYMAYMSPSVEKQKCVLQNISRGYPSKEVESFVNSQFHVISLTKKLMEHGQYLFKVLTIDKLKPSLSTALNTSKPFIDGDEEDSQQWLESLRYTSRKVLPTESLSCHFYDKGTFDVEKYGGELGLLPERGNKSRVIAMPHAELQIFLKPLHDTCQLILNDITEDCSFAQDKGAKYAQQCLKEGRMVHSVDLSAATDRFPLHLQMGLLRKLCSRTHLNWASFFERSASLLWKTPFGDISYGVGQPMGLYGSFAIFSLTHHAILHQLIERFSIPLDKDGSMPYRILGDDIIIANDDLAFYYKDYLEAIGVSVSPSKTISSFSLAEFAGFVITRKSLMKPVKPVKVGMTVANMINYINTLSANPFKGRLKDLGDLLMFLPSPYGCGFNPHGYPRSDRLRFYQSEEITEKVLSVSSNIDTHLFAKTREHRYWNEYMRSYQPSTLDPQYFDNDVILSYFSSVASDVRTELSNLTTLPGDARFKREHLLNKTNDSDNKLPFIGSLGKQHRTMKLDEYISDNLSWYKKLFGFYPWKT